MTERFTKRVYTGAIRGYALPSDPNEFINKINEMVSSVPKEYRSTAKIEVDIVEEFGCAYAEIDVHYRRPETDSEMDVRLNKIDHQKTIDLNNLKRLMEKYPDEV